MLGIVDPDCCFQDNMDNYLGKTTGGSEKKYLKQNK